MNVLPTYSRQIETRKIFISHRHRDEAIASTMRKHLQSWSIPENCIFQSSSYRNSGRLGHNINEEICSFLQETKLVILIYTYPDENWDYCMYECGLATNPATEKTSVIVFQCSQYQPRVFQHELLITPNRDGINRFALQFHRSDNFFPGLKAFNPDLTDEEILFLAEKLYEDLKHRLPQQRPVQKVRWGHFVLRLSPLLITELKGASSIEDSLALAVSLRHEMLINAAAGFGLRHFGYQDFEDNLNFQKALDRWSTNIKSSLGVSEM